LAKTVTKIPASISRFTAAPIGSQKKRKVAGYARVSTDQDEQLTSYEAQLDYYTNYIKAHDDWEFAGMYSDEGISGTNTKRREGFKRMVDDALAGKIDLILTKSVSRFARNTVDSLTTIRKLKEHGTEVYFEKENIWTFDSKGELLITIMSSLAQEESRSISLNVTWGQRKRFQDGKVSVAYSRFLGYDKGPDGKMVINEEQAPIIRQIYKWFLEGFSYTAIARKLEAQGIKSPGSSDKWSTRTVKSILTNEKYKGDALLQKQFTVDFLSKKSKKNEGEVPQYYVTNDHPAIIAPDVFDMVQEEVERRSSRQRYSGSTIFSGKIICGECGGCFGPKVWHSTDRYRKVIWRCNHKYAEKGRPACESPHITEDEIKGAYVRVMNQYVSDKNATIRDMRMAKAVVSDTSRLDAEKQKQADEMNVVADLIQQVIAENASVAKDQKEYEKHYNGLVDRYNGAKKEYERVDDEIRSKNARSKELGILIKKLEEMDGPVIEFNESLFGLFIDHLTVYKDKRIIATMKDGTEIEA
jgi:site-specific DNA recombinase